MTANFVLTFAGPVSNLSPSTTREGGVDRLLRGLTLSWISSLPSPSLYCISTFLSYSRFEVIIYCISGSSPRAIHRVRPGPVFPGPILHLSSQMMDFPDLIVLAVSCLFTQI